MVYDLVLKGTIFHTEFINLYLRKHYSYFIITIDQSDFTWSKISWERKKVKNCLLLVCNDIIIVGLKTSTQVFRLEDNILAVISAIISV